MRILQSLRQKEVWERFLGHVQSNDIFVDNMLIKHIQKIIEKGVEHIDLNVPLPIKKEIAKYKNSKKRTIYSFGEPYNTYFKCINYILQNEKKYSDKFCINSIAYQQGKSTSKYVDLLQKEILSNRRTHYIKTDFSDYFNSIKEDILIQKIESFFEKEDQDFIDLLKMIFTRKEVIQQGQIVDIEQRGVMAGIPISGYLANIYMNDVDWEMYRKHIYYMRYADDVIILTRHIEKDMTIFNHLISLLDVKINNTKTESGKIHDGLVFLGFHIKYHEVDVAERAVVKMKKRIKRRSKWFNVWLSKHNVNREIAARTFIKGMNGKLYSRDSEDQTCWIEWYGKTITTDKSLKDIDSYMIQYIRYILSGKHLGYKKHSEITYEHIKSLGFRSLVNEYWKIKKI
jgi:hypothetical protein